MKDAYFFYPLITGKNEQQCTTKPLFCLGSFQVQNNNFSK